MARDEEEDEEENAFEKADESELKLAAIEPPNAVLAPPAAAAAEPELLALALGALAAAPKPKLLRNQEEGERELDADAATRDFASTAAAPLDENAPISFLSFVSSDACNAMQMIHIGMMNCFEIRKCSSSTVWGIGTTTNKSNSGVTSH